MSILALLLLLNIAALVWLAAKPFIAPTLKVSLVLYFTSWLLVPIILTVAFWNRVHRLVPADRDVYMAYSAIEAVCFLATLLLFGAMISTGRNPFRFLERGALSQWMLPARAEVVLIVFAVITNLLARQALLGGTYQENNAAALRVTAAIQGRANLILLLDSLVCAFLYATMVRGVRNRILTAVLWIWIFVAVAQWLPTGQRAVLLMPCVLFVLWIHEHATSRRKLVLGYAGVALFLATVGVGGMLAIAAIRDSQRVNVLTTARATTSLAKSPPSKLAWKVVQHLQIKFDSIGGGVALVEKYGRGAAGFRPYEGALLALVPRILAPHKPVPGSSDGTLATTPPRLASGALGYDPRIANVGVSASGIELWHFGIAGMLVLVILNALHFGFVQSLLACPGIVPRTLAMYLLGLPLVVTLYASGDVLLMNVLRILALYGIAALALFIVNARRPAARTSAPAP